MFKINIFSETQFDVYTKKTSKKEISKTIAFSYTKSSIQRAACSVFLQVLEL